MTIYKYTESFISDFTQKSNEPPYLKPEFYTLPTNPFMGNPFLKLTNCWAEITKYSTQKPGSATERFCEHNEHTDPDIIHAFGGARPPANHFLLHRAKSTNIKTQKLPVLLVHGAGHNANVWCGLTQTSGSGLVQFLVDKNFPVYAITFSHPHGDNYFQAEQLAEAIKQVKNVTGSARVDLVVHSKGGIPARMYLSSIRKEWGTPYQGDVRRLVMLGVPNRGLDYTFRKPLVNYIIYVTGANGPVSWEKMLYLGQHIDTIVYSLYCNGAFPGQSQLLYRWDRKYPLEMLQPDWLTTYYGGEGVVSHSRGIDRAIAEGEYLIEQLEEAGIDKSVEVAVLAGNKNDLGPIFGIASGPSDGMLFVDSALHTDALTQRGAKLLVKEEMPVNHLELIGAPLAWDWVGSRLEQ